MIIGAMKAGTTSLFSYLAAHPRVSPPILKEIHYFDFHWQKPLDWYLAHFARRERLAGDSIAGEATSGYLAHPGAADRIAARYPEIRAIALLRDPVARAISHYFHELRAGREDRPIGEALLSEDGRRPYDIEPDDEARWYAALLSGALRRGRDGLLAAHPWHRAYVTYGYYADHLERWFRRFDRSRLLVLDADELFRNPEPTYRRVLDFLGLDAAGARPRRAYNVGRYTAVVDPEVVAALAAGFREPNRRLRELLGQEFEWMAR
jgi:hypothetical protein